MSVVKRRTKLTAPLLALQFSSLDKEQLSVSKTVFVNSVSVAVSLPHALKAKLTWPSVFLEALEEQH